MTAARDHVSLAAAPASPRPCDGHAQPSVEPCRPEPRPATSASCSSSQCHLTSMPLALHLARGHDGLALLCPVSASLYVVAASCRAPAGYCRLQPRRATPATGRPPLRAAAAPRATPCRATGRGRPERALASHDAARCHRHAQVPLTEALASSVSSSVGHSRSRASSGVLSSRQAAPLPGTIRVTPPGRVRDAEPESLDIARSHAVQHLDRAAAPPSSPLPSSMTASKLTTPSPPSICIAGELPCQKHRLSPCSSWTCR